MKKILLTAFISCITVGVFAQGAVQFRNYITTTTPPIDTRVTDGTTGLPLDGSNTAWRAALIGGPTTATPTSLAGLGTLAMMYYPANTTLTWVNFRTGTVAPNLSGTVNVGTSAGRAVPGVDWGGTALVQMVAWEGNYATWTEAWTAANAPGSTVRIGWSNPLTLTLPTSSTSTTLTYLWGLNSFAINPIPEPTIFALAGLGAAALLIFRRRN